MKIAITPNRYTRKSFLSIIEKVEALGFPYSISENLIPARENTGRNVTMPDVEDYIEWHRITNSRNNVTIEPVEPIELPDANRDGIQTFGLRCGAGRSSFAVKHDGKMCVCVSLPELTADITDQNFYEAWETINGYANSYPFPQECIGCAYDGICFQCPAAHSNASKGHCDPYICERTRRFVAAGLKKIM